LKQIRGYPAENAVRVQEAYPYQAFSNKQDQQRQDQESVTPSVKWPTKTIAVLFFRFFSDPAYYILKNPKWTYGTAVNPTKQGGQYKNNEKACSNQSKNRKKVY
jgi:hypothetical protein